MRDSYSRQPLVYTSPDLEKFDDFLKVYEKSNNSSFEDQLKSFCFDVEIENGIENLGQINFYYRNNWYDF